MDIEIVSPRESEDGIVFYVSADGEETGVSVRGLSRLAGYKSSSGDMFGKSQLFTDMINGVVREDIPECLKPAWGNVFCQSLKGNDGAKIVTSLAAVCIIEYRAFDSKNDIALSSFRKFSRKGFDSWVKEIVNFCSEPSLNSELLDTLKQMNGKLDAVSAKVTKWDKIEGITATIYPGMKLLNEALSMTDVAKLLPSGDLYTTREWLLMKGIIVDKSTFYSFSRQAADTYKTMTGNRPKAKYSVSPRTGRQVKDGNGYKVVDFVILESAWQAFTK